MTKRYCNFSRLMLLCFLALGSVQLQAQSTQYDKALADSLGGDDYGMKRYVLVILKTGQAVADKATIDSLFQGHMANINSLARSGKLVVAGPIQKNDRAYRGIFILNVPSVEEAKALLQTDPAISGKLLDAELFSWYGSAALPMYLPYHEKLEKKKM